MSDDNDYDWVEDAIASWTFAIKMLRERYLEDRLPGGNAKQWLERSNAYKVDR